ncbi:MAG TPA: hypothetical protein VL992_02850 [Tepidisphaeraceae bacterium]|nr:hypothetical protein [Tepidisphaeraceae bacterium]
MQFLVHAPAEIAEALKTHGHKTHSPEEWTPPPDDLLKAAAEKQWDLITTDARVAMSAFDGRKPFNRCIVYLQSPDPDAIDRLFQRFKRLSPGRLYTVTANRVKVRQLPGK